MDNPNSITININLGEVGDKNDKSKQLKEAMLHRGSQVKDKVDEKTLETLNALKKRLNEQSNESRTDHIGGSV